MLKLHTYSMQKSQNPDFDSLNSQSLLGFFRNQLVTSRPQRTRQRTSREPARTSKELSGNHPRTSQALAKKQPQCWNCTHFPFKNRKSQILTHCIRNPPLFFVRSQVVISQPGTHQRTSREPASSKELGGNQQRSSQEPAKNQTQC